MWYQLKISGLTSDLVELLSEQLDEFGAVSITYMDDQDVPIYEPELNTTPLWEQTVLTALFTDETLRNAAQQMVVDNYSQAICQIEQLEDRQWEREWLKSFKPMLFGRRLWVCPSHYEPPQKDDINIMLDPGLAFGTGTHPTTSLCLKYLDGQNILNKVVADYGTGSGILAIAALKLGASHAFAVDIDPQAIIATKQNCQTNEIADSQISVGLVNEISIPKVDIMLANILAGPLVELAPVLTDLVKPGAQIAISGLLVEQVDEVCCAYKSFVKNIVVETQDEWALCIMTL